MDDERWDDLINFLLFPLCVADNALFIDHRKEHDADMEQLGRLQAELDKCIHNRDIDAKHIGACHNQIDELQAETARLREALGEVIDWLENAPFDYRNGVTHNGIDEGHIYGWKGHNEIVKEANAALAPDEDDAAEYHGEGVA